jgi:hypothetical protein
LLKNAAAAVQASAYLPKEPWDQEQIMTVLKALAAPARD